MGQGPVDVRSFNRRCHNSLTQPTVQQRSSLSGLLSYRETAPPPFHRWDNEGQGHGDSLSQGQDGLNHSEPPCAP